jgi:hypothetical protein
LKNCFNKRKKSKEWGNWKIKQQKFWLNNEIARKKFNKSAKDNIRNFKKWGPKWKTKHIRNCNWKTKLERVKTSINEKGTKQKIIEWELKLKSKKQIGQWYT